MKTSFADRKTKLNTLLENSKAAILDFDGLLADSEPFHYKADRKSTRLNSSH